MATATTVPRVCNLVGARWHVPKVDDFGPVFNPASGDVIARVPLSQGSHLGEAVLAAREAFPAWSQTPVLKRAAVMFAYKSLLEAHFEELARLITRENGKTLDEARGDLRRGIEVVEFACGIPQLVKGEVLPQLAEQLDGAATREPLGVCAGITPFNFPAMVPLWMFPLAVACGNTFVLKPSEKVPLTANRLAELALEAGFPPGGLNVVHGGSAVVEAICTHPDVAAISFVGSTRVAERVYALGCQHGKRVQAAGGAKNVMVVMPDAEPDSTVRAVMGAAYGCAGQRCMAGSVLMGVESAGDLVCKRLHEAIGRLKVADPLSTADAQMGPLVDGAARDRVIGYIEAGIREGAELVHDGRQRVPETGFFVGPTLFDHVAPEMTIAREEIFGPVLSMLRPRDLDEAIDWANRNPLGNGASIFTGSGSAARKFAREIRCGMIGVNVGVPAPMALFAFSGWKGSFFGDLHVQGIEGVMFYTRQKVVLSRWDANYERRLGW
jgi:malonate-semialdehyde dehydrogenase (acetylating)/methylmalonate-semialdehyde dehydrogenase